MRSGRTWLRTRLVLDVPEELPHPYSCRGRSFCPSCEKKRSLLWAEWLRQEVLEPVPHRHVVVTIPRHLRPLFRRRRELLRDLARCASDALGAYVEGRLVEDLRPGIVVSIATAGDFAHWHSRAKMRRES